MGFIKMLLMFLWGMVLYFLTGCAVLIVIGLLVKIAQTGSLF